MGEGSRDRQTTAEKSGRTSELAARLVRNIALLVRLEVESAVAGHAARVHELRRQLVLLLVGVGSLAAAALAGSWALVRLLDTSVRGWLAAAIVAAGWLLVGWLPLARFRRTVRGSWEGAPAARLQAEKAQVEADAAATAEALLDDVADQLARHEERRLVQAGEHELASLEHEVEQGADAVADEADELEERAASALEELVEIITLPGRAGIDTLRRLLP
jgi:hypothetical protein